MEGEAEHQGGQVGGDPGGEGGHCPRGEEYHHPAVQTDTYQLQRQQTGAEVGGGQLQPPGQRDVLGAADEIEVISDNLGLIEVNRGSQQQPRVNNREVRGGSQVAL